MFPLATSQSARQLSHSSNLQHQSQATVGFGSYAVCIAKAVVTVVHRAKCHKANAALPICDLQADF